MTDAFAPYILDCCLNQKHTLSCRKTSRHDISFRRKFYPVLTSRKLHTFYYGGFAEACRDHNIMIEYILTFRMAVIIILIVCSDLIIRKTIMIVRQRQRTAHLTSTGMHLDH